MDNGTLTGLKTYLTDKLRLLYNMLLMWISATALNKSSTAQAFLHMKPCFWLGLRVFFSWTNGKYSMSTKNGLKPDTHCPSDFTRPPAWAALTFLSSLYRFPTITTGSSLIQGPAPGKELSKDMFIPTIYTDLVFFFERGRILQLEVGFSSYSDFQVIA